MTNIEIETMHAVKAACRVIANDSIDWEQRRYELAKALYEQKFAGDEDVYDSSCRVRATIAIHAANIFIEEYRKTK